MSTIDDATSETEEKQASTKNLTSHQETAQFCARLGLEKKASDVTLLDIHDQGSYTDSIVLMSADSDPQMTAIADHIEATLKTQGRRPMSIEGMRGGQWVLMDYGDVVIHIFKKEAREFYDLDGLWADAKKEVISDDA